MEGKGTDLVTLERSEDSKTKAKGTSHKHFLVNEVIFQRGTGEQF